jgi:hypothetical protein
MRWGEASIFLSLFGGLFCAPLLLHLAEPFLSRFFFPGPRGTP